MMDTKVDIHRFDVGIKELDEQLKANPSKEGGILLYGSSTMGNWRANDMCYKQLAPLPITNTGFGGSTADEALYYYHKLVLPVKPSVMAYYEGANDLMNNYKPQEIIDTSHHLFEWARQDFPGIKFLIVPIKLCLGLKHIEKESKICNKMFEEYAEKYQDTFYLNLDKFLYDKNGEYRTDIYVEDMLHHTEKGYEELAAFVKPALEKLYVA